MFWKFLLVAFGLGLLGLAIIGVEYLVHVARARRRSVEPESPKERLAKLYADLGMLRERQKHAVDVVFVTEYVLMFRKISEKMRQSLALRLERERLILESLKVWIDRYEKAAAHPEIELIAPEDRALIRKEFGLGIY